MKHENTEIIELKGDLKVAMQYENLLVKIATYVFVMSSYHTTNSSRYIYFDDIEKYHGLEPGFIDQDVAEDIENAIYKDFGDFVNYLEVIYQEGDDEHECDRCFSVGLWTNYCVGIIEDDDAIEYELED